MIDKSISFLNIMILIVGIIIFILTFCSVFFHKKAQAIDDGNYTFRSEDKRFIILEYGGWNNDANNQARRISIDKENGIIYLNGNIIYNDDSLKIYNEEDK